MLDPQCTPIVIDNGSGWIKAGLAGEDEPSVVFSTVVGTVDAQKKVFVGNEFQGCAEEELVRTNPIKRGIITDWDAMENIWNHTFHNQLQIAPEEHHVLLSDVPLNPKAVREKMAQIMFETFKCPAVYLANQAALSLYASGRTSGIVLDSGHDVTHIVPIYRGYPLQHAILRLNFAGSHVTDYLARLLSERGLSIGTEIVRDVKEKLGYVAMNYEKEMESTSEKYFQLANGKSITIGNESFLCAEALFQPMLLDLESSGVHQSLFDSIMKSEIDVRKELFANVVLSGGSTMFGMMRERLEQELATLAPHAAKIKVIAPVQRKFSTWIGGSNLATLSSCKELWITKEEYDEFGLDIVQRKCP